VLIDTDVGIDDSLAILVMLAAPEIVVVGIGSSYGNCRSSQSASNALYVLEVAGRDDVPVAVGVPEPSSALAMIDLAAAVHGSDGLGNTGLQPKYSRPSNESAVSQMLRVGNEPVEGTSLLVLGPLTNVATAVRNDPGLLGRFSNVVIMGGMGPEAEAEQVLARYPRYHQVGDPNTRHNPEATEVVARAKGNVTWVGMNVTAPLVFPASILDELAVPGNRRACFEREVHQWYIDFVTKAWGSVERVFAAHDTIAACVLLEEEMTRRCVKATPVVRYGEARRGELWGATPAEGSVVHQFVTEVDTARIEQRMRSALGG